MESNLKLVKTKSDKVIIFKKDYINRQVSKEPRTGVLFTDFIIKTVEKKQKRRSVNYGRNYKTLIYHIEAFSILKDVNIFTNSVNEEFLDDFICYLEEQDLRQTYIGSLLSLVKAMVVKAGNSGYAVDPSYDEVDVKKEDPFAVFLTMNEITRIYYYQGLTRKQEAVRDLFIIGCLTALRFSDYSTLVKEDFGKDFITKITKKTKKKVTVPIHDYVREIYNKYDGNVSSQCCVQHFNVYIKKICKAIGFNELISFSYIKGGKVVTETKRKWEMISSHTARRSAATNMYLTGRMKVYEIMSLTGHTTEKSFFRYIKVTDQEIANQLKADNYFRI